VTLEAKRELAIKILNHTTWISEIQRVVHQITYQKIQRRWSVARIFLDAASTIGNEISIENLWTENYHMKELNISECVDPIEILYYFEDNGGYNDPVI
jgi:hypothetical protein